MKPDLKIKAQDLYETFKPLGLLNELIGDVKTEIQVISGIENVKPKSLVFITKKKLLEDLKNKKPVAVVTTNELRSLVSQLEIPTVFISPNVMLAHAMIKQKFMNRDYNQTGWNKVHSSAVLHDTVKVDSSTVIEPHCVIGKNTKIGKNCRIMAGTIIENDVIIGNNTIIHPRVVIGYGSQIGNDVVIESGSVIGSEGFGFAQDEKRKSYPLPQTGIVIIEDRVRVGANNCIDRAAYETTRIGAGTKMDNFCHVAHNVQIGEDCLLTAFFCVAGTTQIGDRLTASGQTGITDHVTLCNDVTLVHKAGVTHNIEKPGIYAGMPPQPLHDYMKNTVVLKEAYQLKKQLNDLEKK